jgi:adenosylcobinamide-GDP ribazoletransferase
VAIADEMRAAAGAVFGLGALGRDLPREAQVGGLVFYPLVGAGVGAAAGVVAAVAARLGALPSAVAAVGSLAAASGGSTVRTLASVGRESGQRRASLGGLALSASVLAAKVWAVRHIPGGGRVLALVLAAMLGRWAIVVQCYGGAPPAGSGQAAPLVGRARLREFGWASAIAFATTLAALDAVGLLVLLAATLTTIALRVAAYRRAGGVSGPLLDVSLELVETVVLLALAALVRG